MVDYAPEDSPPASSVPAGDWRLRLDVARWTELSNGLPSIEIIMSAEASNGAQLDMWLLGPGDTPVVHWSGGPTTTTVGVVCFQLPLVDLEDESVVLQGLDADADYTFAASFSGEDGDTLAADRADMTHFVPELEGEVPGPGSGVFRDLLACQDVGN